MGFAELLRNQHREGKSAVLVFKEMVLSFFDYVDILIDSRSKKYIEKLQILQFRGIQIISQ